MFTHSRASIQLSLISTTETSPGGGVALFCWDITPLYPERLFDAHSLQCFYPVVSDLNLWGSSRWRGGLSGICGADCSLISWKSVWCLLTPALLSSCLSSPPGLRLLKVAGWRGGQLWGDITPLYPESLTDVHPSRLFYPCSSLSSQPLRLLQVAGWRVGQLWRDITPLYPESLFDVHTFQCFYPVVSDLHLWDYSGCRGGPGFVGILLPYILKVWLMFTQLGSSIQ
jgi:hypothetical protein